MEILQCNSLEWVTLARSFELKKALLETRNLKELIIDTCPKLGTLIIWSEELTSIKGLTDSKILTKLELFCPKLVDFERPPLYVSACMSSFINKVHYTQSLQLRFCYHIAPRRNTEGSWLKEIIVLWFWLEKICKLIKPAKVWKICLEKFTGDWETESISSNDTPIAEMGGSWGAWTSQGIWSVKERSWSTRSAWLGLSCWNIP